MIYVCLMDQDGSHRIASHRIASHRIGSSRHITSRFLRPLAVGCGNKQSSLDMNKYQAVNLITYTSSVQFSSVQFLDKTDTYLHLVYRPRYDTIRYDTIRGAEDHILYLGDAM